MNGRNRRRRIRFLGFVALVLAAVIVLYVTAPPPTVLLVRVLDAASGAPLAGVQVRQPGGTDVDALRLASPVVRDMPVRGQTAVGLSQVSTAANRSSARVILSPDGSYLYTWQPGWVSVDTGRMSDVLLLVFTEDGSSVRQEMPQGVSALVLSPTGDELYALNAKLGMLTIISLTGSRPQTVVPVGKEPQAVTVSADGRWAYVADGEGQATVVVELPSATVWHTISLSSEPLSLAVR